MVRKYVVVDVETTGNSYMRGARVIQVSAVVIESGQIVDQYTSFVHPEGVPIPSFIKELTGIDDEMLADAPTFKEIAADLYAVLKDSIFVAHNVSFDMGFIAGEMESAGFSDVIDATLDTVELANILLPEAYSYKLDELSDQMDLEHINPHQADSDALATAELFLLLLKKARRLPIPTLEMLCSLSKHLHNDMYVLFDSILNDKKKHLEKISDGLEVYRGIALRKKNIPMQESVPVRAIEYPRNDKRKAELLRAAIEKFQAREGQFEMMDTVYDSFTADKHVIIEAGTGIGKTIAYLLPGVYFALAEQKQVIISTYTIQLQHQLLDKEIKSLKKTIPFSFGTALVKGRHHYINLLKFEQSLRELDSTNDELITKMKILVWLLHTKTGDVDELNLSSGGKLFWKRICNGGSFIDRQSDPWQSRDFFTFSKNLASQADIIITNHSMLVAELDGQTSVLPPSSHIIIDEAHHLEKTVRTKLGRQVEYNHIKFLFGKIGTSAKKGYLYKIDKFVAKTGAVPGRHSFEMDKAMTNLEAETEDLFMLICQMLSSIQSKKIKGKRLRQRITKELMSGRQWQGIVMCAERFLSFHKFISEGILERLLLLKQHSSNLTEADMAFLEEMTSFHEDWLDVQSQVRSLLIEPNEHDVTWFESDQKLLPNRTSVHRQFLNTGLFLKENLFQPNSSVVLTSASLTVNQSFAFFVEEMGIDSFDRTEKRIASPFPYKQMAKLFIPTDLPKVNAASMEEYTEAIASHLVGAANAAKGRMLVLFTSHEMLRKTYELLNDSNELEDFVLLAHGVSSGSRSRLVKSFQQFPKSILFGTNSFWEGIDIPGEDLSCLVIVRLPFSPIDEPVTAAKLNMLEARGKNPFSAYSLPEAIIQFKQGFGRLIRSQTDKGVFFVFDQRIITTVYGKAFLRSIPAVDVEKGPIETLLPKVEDWLKP